MPFSEDIRKLLEDKLFLTKYLTSDNIDSFYNVMAQYFTKKRFSYFYFSDLHFFILIIKIKIFLLVFFISYPLFFN